MSSCLVGARWVSNLSVRPDWQETKKRKKSMQTNSNRRGLAIGAMVALVGSFFGMAPASYAVTDGQYIDVRPLSNAAVTNFGGLLTEDFPIYAQLKSGTTNAAFSNTNLRWRITHVSGTAAIFAVATTVSADVGAANTGLVVNPTTLTSTSAQIGAAVTGNSSATASNVASISHTTSVGVGNNSVSLLARVNSAGVAPLFLSAVSASAFTSQSPNSVFDVTIFIDDFGGTNGLLDSGEWFTTVRVTLNATGRLAPVVSVGAPARNDTVVTASATLNTVNWSNLDGKPFIEVRSSDTTAVFTGNNNTSVSPALSGAAATARAGVVTFSFAVSALTESTTISGVLRYSTAATPTVSDGVQIGATTSAVVSAPGVTRLVITASNGVNIVGSTSTQLDVRPNQSHTIQILASTGSGNASVSTDVVVNVTSTALSTGSKMISINGGAFVGSAVTLTVTTGRNGVGTFTLATSGFVNADDITVTARVGNITADPVTVRTATPTFTVVGDSTHYVTTPGTAVNIGFTVRDQFGVLSSRTDHFLRVTRAGTAPFNYTATVSYTSVAAGRAVVAFTPQGATATGSDVLTIQSMRLEDGAYTNNGGSTSVTVVVTSSAIAFSTGLAASRAASVSYFPSTVSWSVVTGSASAAGAGITVTGADLVFRLSAAVPATTSGSLSLNAGAAGAYSFEVASLKPGTKTMTLAIGTSTTTSLLVVSEPASDFGRSITWDTTTIEAGKTRVITGTLLDANGNPVDTTAAGYVAGDAGTASIAVTFAGTAGIVVGTTPTETDAAGKFRVSVLTSAADSGTLTLTAVYMPQGASTLARNQISSVQTITVAPAAAPEVNAVIGSFNGRWAVRVENAKGSVVSVKAGNRWVKYTSLNNNYLYSMRSVKGRTIAVSVWVDGELQNSQTITIK